MKNESVGASEGKPKHGEKQNDEQAVEYLRRKVPLWFNRPDQKNARTLIQFMKLSGGGLHPVLEKDMEDSGHPIPASMRAPREGQDGFVFDYKKGEGYVRLWNLIQQFIMDEWRKHPELHD